MRNQLTHPPVGYGDVDDRGLASLGRRSRTTIRPASPHGARWRRRLATDKDGWLSLYADDALVEDPVGPSPFDPEGAGHRGHERLAAFWDGTIASTERLDFEITESFVAGDEVANIGDHRRHAPGGYRCGRTGIYVYRVGTDGRSRPCGPIWEFDRAMGTLAHGEVGRKSNQSTAESTAHPVAIPQASALASTHGGRGRGGRRVAVDPCRREQGSLPGAAVASDAPFGATVVRGRPSGPRG